MFIISIIEHNCGQNYLSSLSFTSKNVDIEINDDYDADDDKMMLLTDPAGCRGDRLSPVLGAPPLSVSH